MTFSIMLWMPSWGGMINGLMTLSGAWDKLRTDPVLRLLGRRRRLLRHGHLRRPGDVDPRGRLARAYTDWGIGHVIPARSAGSRSFRSARSIAWSRGCGNARSFIRSGSSLALLDRDAGHRLLHHLDVGRGHHAGPDVARLDQFGFLQYSFAETVAAMHPYLCHPRARRAVFLSGALIMVFNLIMTVAQPGDPSRPRLAPRRISSGRGGRIEHHVCIRHEFIEKTRSCSDRTLSRSPSAALSRSCRCSPSRRRSSSQGRAALLAAGAARPRHLRARRLLSLPLAR